MKKKLLSFLKDSAKGFLSAVKILLSVCLLTGMFYGAYSYLNEVFDNKEISKGEEFHNVPENTMDIIVLGSSHSQYSFMPGIVYEDTGLYSYVLGSACQPFSVSYEMLKEALKTQSPELVVMEVFTGTPLKSTCFTDSCYVTAAYQMTGDEKYETLSYLEKEKAESYYNPLINNHNNWKTMDSLSDLIPTQKSTYYGNTFGYVENDFVYANNYWRPNVYSLEAMPEVEMLSEDKEALENIWALCEENDMELMFYMVPCDNISIEDQAYRYKIWEWAEEHGVNYQDYVTMAEEIDFRMCIHSDGFHPYVSGAALITDELARYIDTHYEFDSHEENEEVSGKLNTIYNSLLIESLTEERNPALYLKRLENHSGTIVIRYLAGEQKFDESIVELMRGLGCSEEFKLSLDYYAIIQDGKIMRESHEPFSYVFETGEEFELNRDSTVYYDDMYDYADPFSVTVFSEDFSRRVVKHIVSTAGTWRDDGALFWDRDYDIYYTYIGE